ncbi:membrane protein [Vallitalea sediminicola]
MIKEFFWKRLGMVISGIIGTAIGCGLLKFADLGIDPFNALVTGMANLSCMQYGMICMLVTGAFLVITLIFDRHYIGIATIFSLFLFGYMVEYTLELLIVIFPNADMFLRVITLMLGLLIISASSSLYFTANMGVSTYDAISLILADKLPIPFRICRIISDVLCVIIGFIFNATIGIGTIITAFFLGSAIDFFNKRLAKPLLYGKCHCKTTNHLNKEMKQNRRII